MAGREEAGRNELYEGCEVEGDGKSKREWKKGKASQKQGCGRYAAMDGRAG